jgi:hypothetical protein
VIEEDHLTALIHHLHLHVPMSHLRDTDFPV